MIAQGARQRAYVAEKTKKNKVSLIVSDSPRSRKVHGKEHMQLGNETI